MATQKIRGLDDALKTLGKMDPVLRRAAVKRLKGDVQPIVSAIKSGIPKSPLSNWVAPKQSSARRGTISAGRSGGAGTPYWEFGKAKSGLRSSVKKQSYRRMNGKAILVSIRQSNGAGEVFDMAGKKTNSIFTRNLTAKWGGPSRRMWPAAEKHKPAVVASINKSVTSMEDIINEELRARGYSRSAPRGSGHFR